MKKTRGFTLIELIIGITIVGILMAIAVPSYQNHLRKGRRAEAQAFLMQVSQRQQQYLLDARTYAFGGNALTDLGLAPPAPVAAHYNITVTGAANPPQFTVTADPSGSSVQSPDGILSLTQAGQKQRLVGGVDKGW
jgi:type IV pilus assembly protein PilE